MPVPVPLARSSFRVPRRRFPHARPEKSASALSAFPKVRRVKGTLSMMCAPVYKSVVLVAVPPGPRQRLPPVRAAPAPCVVSPRAGPCPTLLCVRVQADQYLSYSYRKRVIKSWETKLAGMSQPLRVTRTTRSATSKALCPSWDLVTRQRAKLLPAVAIKGAQKPRPPCHLIAT